MLTVYQQIVLHPIDILETSHITGNRLDSHPSYTPLHAAYYCERLWRAVLDASSMLDSRELGTQHHF